MTSCKLDRFDALTRKNRPHQTLCDALKKHSLCHAIGQIV